MKAGQWTTSASGAVVADGIKLTAEEYECRLVSKDAGVAADLPGSVGLVVLDTAATPELEAEGLARDLIRVIQQARRDKGLKVSDRIRLTIDGGELVLAAARTHAGPRRNAGDRCGVRQHRRWVGWQGWGWG